MIVQEEVVRSDVVVDDGFLVRRPQEFFCHRRTDGEVVDDDVVFGREAVVVEVVDDLSGVFRVVEQGEYL